jgi:predicted amidophosphoribosyltransferase
LVPLARLVGVLLDLVLPLECAGCAGASGPTGVCAGCAARLTGAGARPTRPEPAPDGLPPCLTAADYDGAARELILSFKERGRRGLAGPLGGALAAAVDAGLARAGDPRLVVLLPVPSTAAAARTRHGDHMRLLAGRAARRLRAGGRRVALAAPLRALPRADSAHLDRHARAAAAAQAFAVRARPVAALRAVTRGGATIVLVDDVITTGATLAAAARRLAEHGVKIDFAATVAATTLRSVPVNYPYSAGSPELGRSNANVLGTRGD